MGISKLYGSKDKVQIYICDRHNKTLDAIVFPSVVIIVKECVCVCVCECVCLCSRAHSNKQHQTLYSKHKLNDKHQTRLDQVYDYPIKNIYQMSNLLES